MTELTYKERLILIEEIVRRTELKIDQHAANSDARFSALGRRVSRLEKATSVAYAFVGGIVWWIKSGIKSS